MQSCSRPHMEVCKYLNSVYSMSRPLSHDPAIFRIQSNGV